MVYDTPYNSYILNNYGVSIINFTFSSLTKFGNLKDEARIALVDDDIYKKVLDDFKGLEQSLYSPSFFDQILMEIRKNPVKYMAQCSCINNVDAYAEVLITEALQVCMYHVYIFQLELHTYNLNACSH